MIIHVYNKDIPLWIKQMITRPKKKEMIYISFRRTKDKSLDSEDESYSSLFNLNQFQLLRT